MKVSLKVCFRHRLCGYQTRWEKKAHTIINPQDKNERKRGWEAYDLIVLQGTASNVAPLLDPAIAAARRAPPRAPRSKRSAATAAGNRAFRTNRTGRHETIISPRGLAAAPPPRRSSMTGGGRTRKKLSLAKQDEIFRRESGIAMTRTADDILKVTPE